jgi:hypothetical protein
MTAAAISGGLMPWPSWPAAALEGGQLPQSGGVRPQLTVTVDLDSLLGHPHTPGAPGAVGGEAGGAGPLGPRRVGGWPVTAP